MKDLKKGARIWSPVFGVGQVVQALEDKTLLVRFNEHHPGMHNAPSTLKNETGWLHYWMPQPSNDEWNNDFVLLSV